MTEISKDPRKSGFTPTPENTPEEASSSDTKKVEIRAVYGDQFHDEMKTLTPKQLEDWEKEKEKFKEEFDKDPKNPPPMLLD